MIEVRKHVAYSAWFDRLRDGAAKRRINLRIQRVENGNFGDVKSVGDGVSELRIPHGPGYRVYFKRSGETVVLLLIGGDKGTQSRDIAKAKELAQEE